MEQTMEKENIMGTMTEGKLLLKLASDRMEDMTEPSVCTDTYRKQSLDWSRSDNYIS